MTNVTAIAGGGGYSLALTANGAVVAWGFNSYNQLTVQGGLKKIKAIAAGHLHSLTIKSDGTVEASWGDNSHRQCVVPTALTWRGAVAVSLQGNRLYFGGSPGYPTDFPSDSLTHYETSYLVTNAFSHILALKADGTVVGWGVRGSGKNDSQMSIPPGLTNVLAVASGAYHDLALKADGTVIGWGSNTFGQTTIPAGAINVVAVAAGWEHSMALKANGKVLCWGKDDHQQTEVPASASNVVAIAAGPYNSFALRADGTVVGWGEYVPYPFYGQSFYPSNVVAIAAGFEGIQAILNDGELLGGPGYAYGDPGLPLGALAIVAGLGTTWQLSPPTLFSD